ncbi:MAG: glycine reductase [Pyrinomonadaceae bacterium]|nr:glycine reductase [Pyrinomonadaceae bacterium]
MGFPVIKAVSYSLVHTPDLVRYGSKPERELRKDPKLNEEIVSHLRTFDDACAYPPNQVFVGGMPPESLWDMAKPWWKSKDNGAPRFGPFGEVMPEAEFYGLLRFADEFDLILLEEAFHEQVRDELRAHPLFLEPDLERLGEGRPVETIEAKIANEAALPFYLGERLVGCICSGHEEDPFLTPNILLENLACKATGILAMRWLLAQSRSEGITALSIDYVINCGEEAVGDRYQRGAGNLAKAMAELCGCGNSTGADLKAFCCGPIHSIIVAAGLVQSGIFENVVVVGGGALAKLGMKFRGHLAGGMPILEDVLASFAILIGRHDGKNPVIRLDAIGKHDIHYGGSAQGIAQALIATPLEKLGRRIPDINKYAVELHNPEVTEPSGSGNIPQFTYRTIASLGVLRGDWSRALVNDFEKTHGLPGFSPTQGHVPSAVPYLGHARASMLRNELKSAMFIGKGSLFLGKMTHLSDGMSFILEAPENQ